MKRNKQDIKRSQRAPLATPTDLKPAATKDIAGFHWHMSAPNFRAYHLLLDEQADQLFAMTDPTAERIRRSAAPRSNPSATSAACSAYRIWRSFETIPTQSAP